MKDESGGEGTQELYSGRLARHSATQLPPRGPGQHRAMR